MLVLMRWGSLDSVSVVCVCDFVCRSCGVFFVFFQAEDGIRDLVRSRGLGDVYKRQMPAPVPATACTKARVAVATPER